MSKSLTSIIKGALASGLFVAVGGYASEPVFREIVRNPDPTIFFPARGLFRPLQFYERGADGRRILIQLYDENGDGRVDYMVRTKDGVEQCFVYNVYIGRGMVMGAVADCKSGKIEKLIPREGF